MDHLPFWIRGDPRALKQLLLEGEFTLHGEDTPPRRGHPVMTITLLALFGLPVAILIGLGLARLSIALNIRAGGD